MASGRLLGSPEVPLYCPGKRMIRSVTWSGSYGATRAAKAQVFVLQVVVYSGSCNGRGNDTAQGRNVSEQARPQANSVGCANRRTNTISRDRSTWNECSAGDWLIRSTGERKRTANIARYKMSLTRKLRIQEDISAI